MGKVTGVGNSASLIGCLRDSCRQLRVAVKKIADTVFANVEIDDAIFNLWQPILRKSRAKGLGISLRTPCLEVYDNARFWGLYHGLRGDFGAWWRFAQHWQCRIHEPGGTSVAGNAECGDLRCGVETCGRFPGSQNDRWRGGWCGNIMQG